MKVRRYFAPDMRTALSQVREEQGPNALILSNRKIKGGVELITAVGNEQTLQMLANMGPATERKVRTVSEELPTLAADDFEPLPVTVTKSRPEIAEINKAQPVEAPDHVNGTGKPEMVYTKPPLYDQMQSELKNLRGMIEKKFTSSKYEAPRYESGIVQPERVKLFQRFKKLGISSSIAKSIVSECREGDDEKTAWRDCIDQLTRRLQVASGAELMEKGGVVALVGPTGVGKTTLLTKLAAKYSLEHGNENVVLITTDNRRIGAFDQLKSFGSLIGLSVRTITSNDEFEHTLEEVSDRSLILIDTAGVSYRDLNSADHLSLLKDSPVAINTFLVMSAATQYKDLMEIAIAYRTLNPTGCVLTKLDETTCIGPALSVAIENQLPVVFTSQGQRIPEDVNEASPDELVRFLTASVRRGRWG